MPPPMASKKAVKAAGKKTLAGKCPEKIHSCNGTAAVLMFHGFTRAEGGEQNRATQIVVKIHARSHRSRMAQTYTNWRINDETALLASEGALAD